MNAPTTPAEYRKRVAKFRARAERATLPGLREGYNHLASSFKATAARLEVAEDAAAKSDPQSHGR